jgi:hypothetical protein
MRLNIVFLRKIEVIEANKKIVGNFYRSINIHIESDKDTLFKNT